MELLQLTYFLSVAKHEHITIAAKQLNVSQPSISQSITRLENELGVSLFDRKGRNIYLNECGKVFMSRVESALKTLKDAKDEIISINNIEQTVLHIRFWNSCTMIPELLSDFSDTYPYIKFKTVGRNCEYDLDFSFSSYAELPSPSEILLQEEICVAAPLSHPLSRRDSVDLSELKDEEFICVSSKLPFRQLTDGFCKLAGFEPNIILENEDYRTLEKLLSIGAGISFWPTRTWTVRKQNAKYKLLHVSSPICNRTIYVSWPPNRELSNSAHILKDYAKKYFSDKKADPN